MPTNHVKFLCRLVKEQKKDKINPCANYDTGIQVIFLRKKKKINAYKSRFLITINI